MIKILSLASWRRLAQGSFLALALQLLATGGAWAQASPACDVTLSSMLPNNQAVLKAVCGGSTTLMKTITWTRDLGSVSPAPAPVPFGPFNFPQTTADLFFTTLLTSGTHSYTASGLDSNSVPFGPGKAAVVTLSQPILTVGVSPGGSVSSVPAGINGCTVAGGVNCAFGYDTSTTVVLTPTASSGNSFAGWGGDCSGSGLGNCTISMTTLHTVTATFSTVPTWTVTGAPSPSAGGAVTCTSPVTNGNTTTCAIVITPNYNVTGSSSTCGGSLSGNTYTTGSVTSNCSVTVNFSLAATTSPLNVTISGGGSVSGSVSCSSGTCTANIASGTVVTLTPAPTGSNTFSGWSGCPAGTSANPCSFTMGNTTQNVTANFSGGTTASCGSGQDFAAGADADWNPLTTTKIFPQGAITASGDYGRAVRFVAPPAGKYPNGLVMYLNDQSPQPPHKDAVISTCAHNFTPVGGQPYCSTSGIGNIGGLALFFGQDRFSCNLTPGGTYYLNFRATDLPRGDVSSQFTVM